MEDKHFLFQVVLSDHLGSDILCSALLFDESDCELLINDLLSYFVDVQEFNRDLNCITPITVGSNDDYKCKYLVKCPTFDNMYLGIVKRVNYNLYGNI